MYCQGMNNNIVMLLGLLCLFMVGSGCPTTEDNDSMESILDIQPLQLMKDAVQNERNDIIIPLDDYGATYKRHGEFFSDRFNGYHVGDDLEVLQDNKKAEKVYAISDGRVNFVDWVDGYGGVVTINHPLCLGGPGYESECIPFSSLYGHLDIESITVAKNDNVMAGDVIGILGEGETSETDGERKHLHFAIAEEHDIPLSGYITDYNRLVNWINPVSFYDSAGIGLDEPDWINAIELLEPSGRGVFPLDFEMPGSWDIEWVPSIESWNLYDTRGGGTARERSQVFIRYFDASSFLTLSTVTIHEQSDLTVGIDDYISRRYDIEKKSGVRDFKGQPNWRNERHIVTDFRGSDGFTRYFVVAANPDLDDEIYERILDSMKILE
jgi:hypothetical protein